MNVLQPVDVNILQCLLQSAPPTQLEADPNMHFRYRETLQWVKALNDEITPLSLEGNTMINVSSICYFDNFCASYCSRSYILTLFNCLYTCLEHKK